MEPSLNVQKEVTEFMQLRMRKTELTDAGFLERIQAREGSIYRVAYGYVQNPEDAKDIVQEAVCKAYVAKSRLKDPEKFYPWFFRILSNTAISFLHHSSKTVSLDLEGLDFSSLDEEHWTDSLTVRESLKQLNDQTRTVIVLKIYEDMTFSEISQILKKPEATVKTMYYRGLKFLKERMQCRDVPSSEYPG